MLFLLLLACVGGKYDSYIENCDPSIEYFHDSDWDGYGEKGSTPLQNCSIALLKASQQSGGSFVTNDKDCKDNDAAINPGATEVSGDGVDQDCDGQDD